MAVIYVPRVAGGTLIITYTPGVIHVPLPVVMVVLGPPPMPMVVPGPVQMTVPGNVPMPMTVPGT